MSEQQIQAYDEQYNLSIPPDWWNSDEWRPTKFAYGSGPYGSGYMVGSANTTDAQANNAYCIAMYLMAEGWCLEAICGMLGNIQGEGMTQPGYWQSNDVGVMTTGFGLVQWTPATKYINWAATEWGQDDPWGPYYYSGWYECYRIALECAQGLGGQWIATNDYNFSFKAFARGIEFEGFDQWDRVEYAASAFMYNYERPASYGSESQRRARAHAWLNRLNDIWPDYETTTPAIRDDPKRPGPFFTLADIGGIKAWMYKVYYMMSRRGSAYERFSK